MPPGAPPLETVMTTAADVVVFPAASRATARNVWLPFDAVVVFHDTLYGEVVSSVPRLAPFSVNRTPATPMLSFALADTVTVPDSVAPPAGAEIDTVGAVTSFTTVTVTTADVVVFPAAS